MINYSNAILKYAKKAILFVCLVCFFACSKGKENQEFDYTINTEDIPQDTVYFSNPSVSYVNGLYYLDQKKFSGILYRELKGYDVKTYSSVLNGMLHGPFRSFYKNGKPYEVRNYKENISLGKQYGYWESTGNRKFEYNYVSEKREGIQRSWYANGDVYYVYNYKDDKQEGLQQAWRINGSLFRNFVSKNNKRYGLQKSFSCSELSNEEIKYPKTSSAKLLAAKN
ncbi:toxin-antitoxin system YwqK family antitoxin [Arcticibacterium luteifluviistationis]|uniref:Toxin-antitoxin system YwqK family antitoxin n=1 Tax=Arcticibacterium luteifluviistationis TaxID=1784714 RepID=A0A2Z4GHI3_9BACT|nr:hypothetical protein [Arcticibacterium luteifluviistationis]AWW00264.1 hypothetical protein DJ013_19640 [Arcticibacterium luteifluviistationis]